MISKLCVNTGSVSVGRRKWRPFIEFYLCISESIVIYNTYIYIYINVHIYLLKTRLMHILKFASQLVKPRCKRIVSIYLIYRINFYQLSWVFWKCKVLIVKLSFFSCDQAALQMVFSVRLSVCPSVRLSVTPFWLCSHHRIIMKFSGVITSDRSDVHAKGHGQRSKVKVTEVTTQLYRFRTVTPVWIHIWWWNDAYSLIMLRRGALLFFKVIRQISRSHGAKIVEFDPDWAFPDCNSSLNSPMAMKWCTKLEVA